jgi:hypothetical protein
VTKVEHAFGTHFTNKWIITFNADTTHVTQREVFGNGHWVEMVSANLNGTGLFGQPYNHITYPQKGISPFTTTIVPTSPSGAHFTAFDVPLRHNQGLSTGIYETESFFKVQLRDKFSNVIADGPIKEVQTITTDADSGTFTVSLLGETTKILPVGITASDMEAEFEKLGSIEDVTVSKSVISGTESQYSVTFESRNGDLLPMQINSTGLIKNSGTASATVSNCDWYKVQSISTGVASGTLSGTFYVEYQGSRTIDLQSNITAEKLKIELETLPNIITAIVSRTGPSIYMGYTYTVTLAAVETPRTKLHAESHLLEGSEPFSVVDFVCPVGTAAGRVGEEFIVELKGQNVVLGDANYEGQGIYKFSYMTPESGTYLMKVARALRGGLSGTYYNNRWLYGTAALKRTDPVLNFMWSSYITPTGKDYNSVRWSGYI